LKVVFVSRWGVQCGISTYTDQLALAISKQGPEVECAAENIIGIKEIPTECRLAFDRCWDGRSGYLDGIYQFVKGSRPDVVHFQHEFGLIDTPKQLLDLMMRLKSTRVPTVFTCHTVMPIPHEKNWFFRDVLSKSDAIVAHNEDTKKVLIQWGNNESYVHVIPHGTPEDCAVDDRLRSRKALFLPEDPHLIVAVSLGFITPGKLQHEAIGEVIWLVKEGLLDPNRFLYVVAGEPGQNDPGNIEYCRQIHEMVQSNRAWNYIRIVPRFIPRTELSQWYGAADFVITGSHQTFFSVSGRSHQEMAYGIPSISSNARLLSDLDDTRSLKYEGAFQLRSHILTMVREPILRGRLARSCMDFAKATSWTNVAAKHIELYQQLIDKSKHGAQRS